MDYKNKNKNKNKIKTGTTQMQTLDIFLESVKKTFGDPDRARTARAQLHELKMTPGTMAEDYMARFKMLAGRTGFNDTELEDIYIRSGSPQFDSAEYFHSSNSPQWLDSVEDSHMKPQPSPLKPYGVEAIYQPDKPKCRTHKSNG